LVFLSLLPSTKGLLQIFVSSPDDEIATPGTEEPSDMTPILSFLLNKKSQVLGPANSVFALGLIAFRKYTEVKAKSCCPFATSEEELLTDGLKPVTSLGRQILTRI
jgi:hypothetical protein